MLPLIIGTLKEQNDLQGDVLRNEALGTTLKMVEDPTEKDSDHPQNSEEKSISKR